VSDIPIALSIRKEPRRLFHDPISVEVVPDSPWTREEITRVIEHVAAAETGMILNLQKELEEDKPLKRTSAGRKAHEFGNEQRRLLEGVLRSQGTIRVVNGVRNVQLPEAQLLRKPGELLKTIGELASEEGEWNTG
jgi:hypothetical protein